MATDSLGYFKSVRWEEHRVADQAFFFFDVADRESIEVAYRNACDSAAAMGVSVTDGVSVWKMPKERGAWSRGTVNRGVGVIGESRPGTDGGRLVDQPFGRDVS